jgi:cytochrome c5
MNSVFIRILLVLSPLVLWIFSLGPSDGIATAADKNIGRDIFLQNCAACHLHGVAQAPRVGNFAEWEPRLAAGRSNLLNSVLRGKGGMPPKGGNASISDAQAAAALDYVVAQVLALDRDAQVASRSGM